MNKIWRAFNEYGYDHPVAWASGNAALIIMVLFMVSVTIEMFPKSAGVTTAVFIMCLVSNLIWNVWKRAYKDSGE